MSPAPRLRSRVLLAGVALLAGLPVCADAEADPTANAATAAATATATNAVRDQEAARRQELCVPGTVIGTIEVVRVNVFDPRVQGEDRLFFRVVNFLHSPNLTREGTIRRVIPIREGDPCDPQRLEETERDLRAMGFLQDAWVETVARRGNAVDVRVRVQDAWTTRLHVSANTQGGKSQTAVRLFEENLLGTGTTIGYESDHDQDRSTRTAQLSSAALLGRHLQFGLVSSSNSDGYDRSLTFGRPFWSLETPEMFQLDLRRLERDEKVYLGPDPVDVWRLRGEFEQVLYGIARPPLTGGRLVRWTFGVQHDRHAWAPSPAADPVVDRPDLRPRDHDLLMGRLDWEWRRVDYRRVQYVNRAVRVEDLDVGARAWVSVVASLPGLSKDRGGTLTATVQRGFAPGERTFLTIAGATEISRIGADWYNALTSVDLRWYRRLGTYQTVYVRGYVANGASLEGQRRLLLGGDTGLRGYKSRAFSGERLVLLDVEHRFFTPWEWLHIFRAGLVTFVEAGGAWDGGFSRSAIHPDVGVGLRLAILRSSHGTTLHFNVAAPLDRSADPEKKAVRFSFLTLTTF